MAHGRLTRLDLEAVKRAPGVVDVIIVAADIPGRNRFRPGVPDDPLFADGEITTLGQPVFAVIAATARAAGAPRRRAKDVLEIEALPAMLRRARPHAQRGRTCVPPMHLKRGGARRAQLSDRAAHVLEGSFVFGGQEHFYLEGQISYAMPQEDDGMLVHSSTQHPSEMQQLVAQSLGVPSHAVTVECRRMGGGFGGKESQSALFACIAALAARRTGRAGQAAPRPRRRLPRSPASATASEYDYEVGFDDDGRAARRRDHDDLRLRLFSADLSRPPVMTRAMFHFDNAYSLRDVAIHGYRARTNTQSNTAFRGFGGPQGMMAIEAHPRRIARTLGQDPLDVRKRNFYGTGDAQRHALRQTVRTTHPRR